MQQTNQGHQLREMWVIEDAVESVTQSAEIVQKYHKLTAQNVSAVSLEIDQITYRLNHATDQIKRLEGLLTDSRNHCLMWGIGGAIVSSLVMSLVTASFTPPQKAVMQTQSVEPTQSEIVEPVRPAQKPQLRKMKTSKAQRRG